MIDRAKSDVTWNKINSRVRLILRMSLHGRKIGSSVVWQLRPNSLIAMTWEQSNCSSQLVRIALKRFSHVRPEKAGMAANAASGRLQRIRRAAVCP